MIGIATPVVRRWNRIPHKHGMLTVGTGHEIIAPAVPPELQPDLVIAMKPIRVAETPRHLDALGVDSDRQTLRAVNGLPARRRVMWRTSSNTDRGIR